MSPPSAVEPWRLALRVDASPEIGHGHVARSLALGQALISYGADPIVVSRASLPNVRLPVIELPATIAPEHEAVFLASLEPRPVAVIADLFRPTQDQVNELAKGPWALVFLDDGSPIEFGADLLVNPNLNRAHSHRYTQRTEYLNGAQALIVRPEFHNVGPRTIRKRASELLVCMGGSDPEDATSRVVQALQDAFAPAMERATIVLGPDYHGDAASPDDRFVLVRDVRDMSERMQAADIGVLAAGNLLYEAMAVGLPSILIELTREQAREAMVAHEAGAAVRLGGPHEITAPGLARVLAQLDESGARQRLSAHARELVKHHNMDRLAQHVAVICTRRARVR